MSDFCSKEGFNCKYCEEGECVFYSMGSGQMIDMPCFDYDEFEWIPVSERLPEDRREVLVTAYWHETYQVMMASYYGDGLWWCVPFNNCGEHMQRLNPKAWMELPEPYKKD